ncbi:uncharacterized protein C6orf47 homolog [Carettochelys insculpta]|uniref:uncharacterized protein C6orf47 homolog n=1 Tax=Carettochelys insculpta TaxID=44489 RepID=UPI003EB69B91
MTLNRARAWLSQLRWRRREAGPAGEPLANPPEAPSWWGARRLLALLERGGGEPGAGLIPSLWRVPGEGPAQEPPADVPEHFEICFNLARHLFDLCAVALLCACSPAFRLLLDVAGLRGPLKVWLHGLATFLVAAYGLHLALWLVHEYLLQFACLYGALQGLVLCVSLRAAEEEAAAAAVAGSGDSPGGTDPGGGAEPERTA